MALKGIEIKNNILYHNGHWGLGSYDAHGGGVAVDHNLGFGNAQGAYNFHGGGSDYSYTLGTTLSAEPHFVHASAGDFDAHLTPESPAIQAGLNLHAFFATGLDGQSRPATGPWDLGAYSCRGSNALPMRH
jgi:hypothetical protein